MNLARLISLSRFVGIGLCCAGLLASSCPPTDTPTSNNPGGNSSYSETWSVQLDQDSGGTPGRIWLVAQMTLRDDSARGACSGAIVTTSLGAFSGNPSRVSPNMSGSVSGSWTKGDTASTCNAFSLTLSPQGRGDYVVTARRTIASLPTERGFGPVDAATIAGKWTFGGNVQGTAYVYRTALAYMPDSHFDVQMLVSEGGCPDYQGCYLPSAPAAYVCLYREAHSTPFCVGGSPYEYRWLKDTTINTTLPRMATRVDDQWFLNLLEEYDQGGPPVQVGCDRRFDGPDLVQVQIGSGVEHPSMSCSSGWSSNTPALTVSASPASAPIGGSTTLIAAVSGGIGPFSYAWHGYRDDGAPFSYTMSDLTAANPQVALVNPGSDFYFFVDVTDNGIAAGQPGHTTSGYVRVHETDGPLAVLRVAGGPFQANVSSVTFDATGSIAVTPPVGWQLEYLGNVPAPSSRGLPFAEALYKPVVWRPWIERRSARERGMRRLWGS